MPQRPEKPCLPTNLAAQLRADPPEPMEPPASPAEPALVTVHLPPGTSMTITLTKTPAPRPAGS
jgi:hypothetical protein